MELWQPKYLLYSASKWTSFPPGQVADFATSKEALGSALEPERPSAPLILFSEILLTFSSFGVQLSRFPSKFPVFVPGSGV